MGWRTRSRRAAVLFAALVAPAVLGLGTAGAAPAPTTVCTIGDERLTEVSGLASDGPNLYAVNDGGTQLEVYVLGRDCGVRRVISGGIDPYDVEDLARAKDGTLWLADTGDNDKRRDTVALHALRPDGQASLYRLTYPDGQHDAEALLLDRAGVPHVVTKNVLGEAAVYRPIGPLRSPGPTKLRKVAAVSLAVTDTPGGPVGTTGSMLVTGGAVSVDGSVVALRTYTEAYLYPAPDGDVVAALRREPVRISLPNEDHGEAIAFAPNGTLLSVSEGLRQSVRAVKGAVALAKVDQPAAKGASPKGEAPGPSPRPAGDDGLSAVPALAVAVAAVGLVYFVVSKLRRRRG